MRACRSTFALGPGALLAGLVLGLLAAPGAAAAAPDQELPFACAQEWTGTTRALHRPSVSAVDFNRAGDFGQLVLASASGVVSRVEDTGSRSYGKWVQIQHAEGQSTVYAHLKAQWVVPGQFIDQGAPLGRVGASGGVSGPHLHYEQRLGSDVLPALIHQAPLLVDVPVGSQNCPDVPLTGDWDGDRADEVAVFRRESRFGRFELSSGSGAALSVRFGRATDLPVSGDWDGDGVTDVGVRRQATRAFLLRGADGTVTRRKLGFIKDVPVVGDWDGDGVTDVGVWRPQGARFLLLHADSARQVVRLGSTGSQPVTGDWDGDGATDVGVFDAGTGSFRLRTVSDEGVVSVEVVPLGTASDLPVSGDWDGNGITDVGTWAPATATFTLRVSPSAHARRSSASPELRTLAFGRPR